MSLAAATREAVRERPFLLSALRAGLVNYTATAEWLAADAGLDGEADAVATALRRFAADLPAFETAARRASVSMRSGVGLTKGGEGSADGDGLLRVGEAAVTPDGDATAVIATGDVDAAALATVLDRLAAAEVAVDAAGVAGDALVVVVGRRAGADAVRVVEDALDAVRV